MSLGNSSSNPSSTAASATSLPGGGALPSALRTEIATFALARTLYAASPGVTFTESSCADQPTRNSARPILYAGLARSISAVGSTPPMRPRTRNTLTNALGA